jgi:hypothetical protein
MRVQQDPSTSMIVTRHNIKFSAVRAREIG